MAWLSGWTYRRQFNVKHPSGALTDYPVKIRVAESDYGNRRYDISCKGLCKTDFSDIRFTTSDGTTELDFWIERVNGYTPYQIATIWVELDSIGTGSTTFYMYYGNAGAAAASNGPNTFSFFDHFDDSSLDGAKWTDLGGTTESGTVVSIAATSAAARGIIGKTAFGTGYSLRARAYSGHINTTPYYERICWHDPTYATVYNQLSFMTSYINSTYNYKAVNYLTAGTGTSYNLYKTLPGVFQIFEISRNSNVNAIYLIENEENANEQMFGANISTNLYTGNLAPHFSAYNNLSTLVVDWVLVRKYDSVDPVIEGFGLQEEDGVTPAVGWLSDWAYRFKLTIDTSLVDESLINFPVAIKLGTSVGSGADDVSAIFDELGANKLKIAITGSDGTTQLYCEVASWDNANEKATLHVKVPHLSGIVDTDLYLYYDNSKADNSSYIGVLGSTPSNNVWDRWFLGVYHHNETASGAESVKDSTKWANHGSPGANAPSLVDAQHDKGLDFEKSSSQTLTVPGKTLKYTDRGIHSHTVTISNVIALRYYHKVNDSASYFSGTAYLNIPDHADWQLGGGSGEFTMEAWIFPMGTPSSGSWYTICSQYVNASNYFMFGIYNNAGTLRLSYHIVVGGSTVVDQTQNFTDYQIYKWFHVAVTREGNDFKLWVNGQQLGATVTDADSTPDFAAVLQIGRFNNVYYFVGYIEEFRISTVCRYTAAFNPPIDPLVSDANTTLLLPLMLEGCTLKGSLFGTSEAIFNLESFVASSANACLVYESTNTLGYGKFSLVTLYQAAADTRLAAYLRDTDTGTPFSAVDSATLSLATWYHTAARFNCAKSLLDLSKNGAVVAQNTASKGPTSFNALASDICVGWYDGSTDYYHDGVLDEVRISAIDRSIAWIKATYNTLFDLLHDFGSLELLPTTAAPTTAASTTVAPTTLAPTTLLPTTLAPTTLLVSTPVPTTILTTPAPSLGGGRLVNAKLLNKLILLGRLVQ